MLCGFCKGQGMTGWEKPMGANPDGTVNINMVWVPQFCHCDAGQALAKMNAPDATRTSIQSIAGMDF